MLTLKLCNATILHMNQKLITTSEACEVLNLISRSTLSRYVATGRLSPAMKMPGTTGAFLFSLDEIERFKAERDQAKSA